MLWGRMWVFVKMEGHKVEMCSMNGLFFTSLVYESVFVGA